MLDVVWALFDLRMLRNPDADPNLVWAEITSRYLHIKPHPRLAWWAVRVQLVHKPGYMVNYGLGAVITRTSGSAPNSSSARSAPGNRAGTIG